MDKSIKNDTSQNKIDISIISPVYNEEKNISKLFLSLNDIIQKNDFCAEIIFIDDGSTDRSYDVLKELAVGQKSVHLIRFRRNFGQTAAMAAGIENAKGEIIIFIDSDLQNDPTDIPLLIDKLDEGYDVVSGWRKNRKDSFFKRIPSVIANKIIRILTGVNIHDTGCTLKAYRREIISEIKIYGEMHRFIPVLASGIGAKITEIEVNHHPRTNGKSNYGLGRAAKVMLDLITVQFMGTFRTKPIYLYGGFALICFMLSAISGTAVIHMKIFWQTDMTGNPILLLTVLFISIAVILLLLGIQAEVLTRIYHQSDSVKQYHIKETYNL